MRGTPVVSLPPSLRPSMSIPSQVRERLRCQSIHATSPIGLCCSYLACCAEVTCPAGSTGTAVHGTSGTGGTSGCTTNAGYSGKVTATQVASGDCVPTDTDTCGSFHTTDITGTRGMARAVDPCHLARWDAFELCALLVLSGCLLLPVVQPCLAQPTPPVTECQQDVQLTQGTPVV